MRITELTRNAAADPDDTAKHEVRMSKVESNDEIRIREMQEAQRKAEVREQSAHRARRAQVSFKDTLNTKRSVEVAEKERMETVRKKQHNENQSRQQTERSPREKIQQARQLAHKSVLENARSLDGRLKRRTKDSIGENTLQLDRAQHHTSKHMYDKEVMEERIREEDAQQFEATEEKQDILRRDVEYAQITGEASERRRQSGQGHQDEKQKEPPPQPIAVNTQKTSGAGGGPQIPPDLLKRITSTVLKIVEDGRTSLRVRLKGPGLEGVELEVRTTNGQVECRFSGCHDKLRQELEKGAPELNKALEQRGLQLKLLVAH